MKKILALLTVFMMLAAVIPVLAEEAAAPAETQEAPAEPQEAPAEETQEAKEPQIATETVQATEENLLDNQKLNAAYTLALNAITSEDYETAKEYTSICFAYCDRLTNPAIFADLLLKRACIDVIEQKNDMALLNLDAALRVAPNLAEAYLVRTQIYANAGNTEKSIENLEQYIELSHDTSLYETVAQLQEAQGNIEAAQAAYDKYVQGAGADVEEAGFQNGLYKLEAGNYAEAIADFEAYTENETYASGAYYNIGVCKMNSGDYAGAVEAFKACEEKGGSFEGLYYNRGVCNLMSTNWADAEADFAKSIETEPYADESRYNIAVCKMQQNDFENAVSAFTEYIGEGSTEERTVNNAAYYFRAACESALGNLEAAVADYTLCIDNGYELSQSYYERAQIYAALGETEKQNEDLANSLKFAQ